MENTHKKSFQEAFKEVLLDMRNFARLTFARNIFQKFEEEKKRKEVYKILSPEMSDKYIRALVNGNEIDKYDYSNSRNKESLTRGQVLNDYLIARSMVKTFVSKEKQSKLEKLGVL